MDVIKIASILTVVTLFLFGGFVFLQYFKGEPVFEDIYEDIECSVEEVYKNKNHYIAILETVTNDEKKYRIRLYLSNTQFSEIKDKESITITKVTTYIGSAETSKLIYDVGYIIADEKVANSKTVLS